MASLRAMFAACAIATLSSGAGADLLDDPVVWQNDTWEVRKSIDSMTDKVSCTGLMKENYFLQLSRKALYIGLESTPQLVTMRYDSNPAEDARLPREVEEQIEAVVLSGQDFDKVKSSSRIRSRVATYRGIQDFDIDVSDANEVIEQINQCEQRG